jgi:glycine oxidase
MDRFELLVLGGGVVGLSIALEGARRGLRVGLVERGLIGRESSWAGAGILPAGATVPVDDPIEQLRQLSDQLHSGWATWLMETTGIDNEYRRSGGLYLAMTPAERATLRANQLWWDELGIDYEKLDHQSLRTKVASVSDKAEGYFVPSDAKLRNPRHLSALRKACELLSVSLLEGTEVTGFDLQANRISHVKVTGRDDGCCVIPAERICVATGAWSSLLTKELGIETQIYPVRGQMLLYRFDRIPFPMVINEGHRYLVPREDGHVLVGSCEEEVGFDRSTSAEMIEQLRRWASDVIPEFKNHEPVQAWAGLRPGSIDAFPYLGTLYPYENAYLAAGHFRHGLHWSTATAQLMVEHMLGERTTISLEPFRVQRGNTLPR